MANNKISIRDLEPNQTVKIKGTVAYTTNIANPMTPEDIDRENQHTRSKYPLDRTRTFRRISLTNVTVLADDPSNPKLIELWANQQLFKTKSDPNTWNFKTINSGRQPALGVQNADGSFDEIPYDQELARGQEVILVMGTYRSRTYGATGMGIRAVLCTSEPKWHDASGVTDLLASAGIVFNANPAAASPQATPEPATAPVAQFTPATQPVQAQPQPQVQPQVQPTFEQPVAQMPPMGADAYPAQPIRAEDAYQATGGIRFDPAENN